MDDWFKKSIKLQNEIWKIIMEGDRDDSLDIATEIMDTVLTSEIIKEDIKKQYKAGIAEREKGVTNE